ncbi:MULTISPECIES: hypothetical protein [Asaia]|uniref:Transposase n=1 Tax=Asaia bogorensis TaxID=91915 RepID=A0A060QG00_9PROT|nr:MULTISPECIES: hypothetical protein [Asaia]ETD00074.1 hypothetical protein P792_00500 [Asaia sp. SF2.1]CDG39613.1 hypothetical protein ASAP_1568 [Asaia bogorensis]
MLNLFRTPYARRLEAENRRLSSDAARMQFLLWEAKTEPARTLALMAAKDKEIATLKAENRALKRERDRAGRFAPCEK